MKALFLLLAVCFSFQFAIAQEADSAADQSIAESALNDDGGLRSHRHWTCDALDLNNKLFSASSRTKARASKRAMEVCARRSKVGGCYLFQCERFEEE